MASSRRATFRLISNITNSFRLPNNYCSTILKKHVNGLPACNVIRNRCLKPPSGISEEPQRTASIRRLYVRFKRSQRDRSFVRIPCQPKGGWLVYRHDSNDRVTRLNQTKAEDSQHEQTDRCSRRWPVRNGCIRTSFGPGSIGSCSCFDRSQVGTQEVDPQEGHAQEGSYGCCRFGRVGVSCNW